MERNPLPALRDLRWPVVGVFFGALLAGLWSGRGVIDAVLMAFGLSMAGLAALGLSAGRSSTRATRSGVLGICLGLFLFALSLNRDPGSAVVTAVGGTVISLVWLRLTRGRAHG